MMTDSTETIADRSSYQEGWLNLKKKTRMALSWSTVTINVDNTFITLIDACFCMYLDMLICKFRTKLFSTTNLVLVQKYPK
jgi:hypothetical protein